MGLCESEGVRVTRGSEADVLGRIVTAARAVDADVVVRVTADCPLIDPGVTDRVVNELITHANSADYASNVLRRTYPRGLDVEAMFLDTLLRVDRLAQTPVEREHVTVTIRSERPDLFAIRSVESNTDDFDLRWTVDEPADLDLVRKIYSDLDLGAQSCRTGPWSIMFDAIRNCPPRMHRSLPGRRPSSRPTRRS